MIFYPREFQALLTGGYDKTDASLTTLLQGYKKQADAFVCYHMPGSPTKTVPQTNGTPET